MAVGSRRDETSAARQSKSFGTEEDKFNCPFYYKIGACRHGDRCSRNHVRPSFSQTLTIPHLYIPPMDNNIDEQQAFEEFFEDVLDEAKKYGNVIDMVVVQNLGEHMNGNVYIKYEKEEEADQCVEKQSNRYYNGIFLQPSLSPVTDFREARCRQHEDNTCNRGGFCNFMHIRKLPRWQQRELEAARYVHKNVDERDDRNTTGYDTRGDEGDYEFERSKRRNNQDDRYSSRYQQSYHHPERQSLRYQDRRRDWDRGDTRHRYDSRSPSRSRSSSRERRERIARWNMERDLSATNKLENGRDSS